MNKGGFSWKRFVGITRVKQNELKGPNMHFIVAFPVLFIVFVVVKLVMSFMKDGNKPENKNKE